MNVAAIMKESSGQSDAAACCDVKLQGLKATGRWHRSREPFVAAIAAALDRHAGNAAQNLAQLSNRKIRAVQVATGLTCVHYILQRSPTPGIVASRSGQDDVDAVMARSQRRWQRRQRR